uniref:Uncharacterized protein n=1 Tax=Anguilla anguilla TaxID=7936 RepID=A0A0E9U4H6_ANGAN
MPHHIIFWCKTTGNFFTECVEGPSIIFASHYIPLLLCLCSIRFLTNYCSTFFRIKYCSGFGLNIR